MAKKVSRGIRHAGVLVVLLALVLLSLLFYTLENTKPHAFAMGVVSLDKGDTITNSGNNLGDAMLEKLTSGEYLNAMLNDAGDPKTGSYTIEFKRYDTEEEVRQAVEEDEIYGAVVIPQDYTVSMLSDDFPVGYADDFPVGYEDDFPVGYSDESPLENGVESPLGNGAIGKTITRTANVVLDVAQNPTVSKAAQDAVGVALDSAGLKMVIEPSTLNIGGSKNIPAVIFHMMLFLPSMAAGIGIGVLYKIRRGATFSERAKRFGVSMLLNAGVSMFLAIALYIILTAVIDFSATPVPSILYIWIIDFLAMVFANGLTAINTEMAVIVAAAFAALGGMFGMLPTESFPPLLQNLIFPWLTDTFTDWNLNTAVMRNAGPWVLGVSDIWVYALIGSIAALMSVSFSNIDGIAEA